MPSKGDIEFGNQVLKDNLLSKQKVEECLKYQGEIEAQGQLTTLDRVMLQKAYLNEGQVFDLCKKLGRRVVFCSKCSMKLNVAGLAVGQKIKCPKCGAANVTPEKISFQLVEKPKTPAPPEAQKVTEVPKTAPPPPPAPAPAPPTVAVKVLPPAPPEIEIGEPGDAPTPDQKATQKLEEEKDDARGKKFANRRYGKR